MGLGARAVRIGVLAPLSRPGWVEAGRHLLAGVELAALEPAAAGLPVELLVRDTAADPRTAEAAVDELAGLGVAALAGEYHSVVARAVAARADALGVPFLCSSAVLDALTEQQSAWVARIAPAQSRGWRVYADFLLAAGHRRVTVVSQPSIYWATGTAILRDHLAACDGTVIELDPDQVTGSAGGIDPAQVCEALAGSEATVLLLLVGSPEPAMPIVRAVRADPRLADVLIGAPAGQPELPAWEAALGGDGAGIPFLRYLPGRLTPLGERVAGTLRERLGTTPSFVAFEGYDTIAVLAEVLRSHGAGREDVARAWSQVEVEGTRGPIRFSRVPGIGVRQWAWPPIQVADRDPSSPARFRVLRTS